MGTEARVVLYAADEPAARAAAEAAFARIAALERVMSDWIDDSELSVLCRAAGGPARSISRRPVRGVVAGARDRRGERGRVRSDRRPSRRSSGGRRAADQRAARSRPRSRTRARSSDGSSSSSTSGSRRRYLARLAKPGMRLDLGGIGKGFAAQEAVERAREMGFPHALVSIAGDVVCRGGAAGPARLGRRDRRGRAEASSSRTPRSRPRATPSSSSRSAASATRTSSIRARARPDRIRVGHRQGRRRRDRGRARDGGQRAGGGEGARARPPLPGRRARRVPEAVTADRRSESDPGEAAGAVAERSARTFMRSSIER